MFSTIKNYLLAGLAVAVGLLAAVASWYRANLKSAQLKGEKRARKAENKATDAMIDGLEAENEIKDDNSTDRSKFLD
jgi:hypothetical protein